MSQPPAGYGYDAVQQHQRPTETMAILAPVFAFVFAPLGVAFTSLAVLLTTADVGLVAVLIGSGTSTAP